MAEIQKINNLTELRAKQIALKAEHKLLGQEILEETKQSLVIFPIASLIKPADPLRILTVDGKIDVPAKSFSYLLPILVNRTLFRKSGFLTRLLTTMVARRIGKKIGPKVASWLLSTTRDRLSRKQR